MLEQVVRAARLDRDFYTRLVFDSYATGNAVLVVAGIYLVLALVRFFLRGIILSEFVILSALQTILFGAIWWIILSLVIWLVGAYLLEGDARLQTVIRLTGFAHVPLLAVVIPVVGFWVGVIWFGAGLTVAAEASLSLERTKALMAAAAGLLAWLVFFGRGLL